MKFSSPITACALAAACLLSTTNAHALTKTQMAVLGGFLANGYVLFQRKVEKGFTPRYSVKKVADVKNFFSKEYFNNLWYIYYDGFIGQPGKTSETAYGVLGATNYYLYPLKKASGAFAFAYSLYLVGPNFGKHIAKLCKHKDDEPKIPAAPTQAEIAEAMVRLGNLAEQMRLEHLAAQQAKTAVPAEEQPVDTAPAPQDAPAVQPIRPPATGLDYAPGVRSVEVNA